MRVLITRPLAGATRTAERLRALGHDPFVAPLLTVEPTGEPPPAGPFDAVLVTSANAVPSLTCLPATATARPVFALGVRTAALLREAGLPNVREGGSDARALAASVRAAMREAATLLHVAGRDRKPEPQASLAAAGHSVIVWTAYAAVASTSLPAPIATALAQGEIDAMLHYSRRSAVILRRLSEAGGVLQQLNDVWHICLSDDVAEALPGARRLAIAGCPSEDAMLAALKTAEPRG